MTMKTEANRYRIGNEDCYISFEMECKDGSAVTIRSFIQCPQMGLDGVFLKTSTVVPPGALEEAQRQIDLAWEWMDKHGIKMTARDRRESLKAAEGFLQRVDSWFIIDTVPGR